MRMFLLAAVALMWSGAALAENLPPPSPTPVPIVPTPDIETPAAPPAASVPLPAPVLPQARPMVSQGDPSWSWVKLGRSTIGKVGCLTMSVYDTFVGMGLISEKSTTPGAFVRMLSAYGLIAPNGDMRWGLGKIFPVWVERLAVSGTAAIKKASYALAQGERVLIRVATKHGTHHWVVISRVLSSTNALIRDPANGTVTELVKYGVGSVDGMAILHPKSS